MIFHGVFECFASWRVGVVELTAGRVPSFLLHIDGALDFYVARHGDPFRPLELRPSDYFLRQVRVAALPYEAPTSLVHKVGPHLHHHAAPNAQGWATRLLLTGCGGPLLTRRRHKASANARRLSAPSPAPPLAQSPRPPPPRV